eukprot:4562360-Alexandrium_andersonii.AAC.1
MSAMAPTDRRRGQEFRKPALSADTTPPRRRPHTTTPRRAPWTNAPPPAAATPHSCFCDSGSFQQRPLKQ